MKMLWVSFVLSWFGNLLLFPQYRKRVFNERLAKLSDQDQIRVPNGLVVFAEMIQWCDERRSTLAIAHAAGDTLPVSSIRIGIVLAQGEMQRFGADVYRNVGGRAQHSVVVRVFFQGREGSEIVESLPVNERGGLPHTFSHRDIVRVVAERFKVAASSIDAIAWPIPDDGWHFTDPAGRTLNVSWTKEV